MAGQEGEWKKSKIDGTPRRWSGRANGWVTPEAYAGLKKEDPAKQALAGAPGAAMPGMGAPGAGGGPPMPGVATPAALAANPRNAWLTSEPAAAAELARKTARGKELEAAQKYAANNWAANVGTAEEIGGAFATKGRTPTGAGAPLLKSLATAPVLKNFQGMFGLPNSGQVRRMERVEKLAGDATLKAAAAMKGALSDKDVAFLKALTYNLSGSERGNIDQARAQAFIGARQKAYVDAQKRWEAVLGSAGAVNANGQDFGEWFEKYAEKEIPNPFAPHNSPKDRANAMLKSKSAKATNQAVSLGMKKAGAY